MIIYKDKAISIINSNNLPKIWLIFGTDEGEIDLIIKKILEKITNPDAEVITIDDISELKNTIKSRSLFHRNKIIVISGVGDAGVNVISAGINHLNVEDYIIVRGGDLKKHSKLRTFFESHETALTLNCYKLDAYGIASVIEGELKQNKIVFDKEIPNVIAGMIAYDTKIASNEIEKIALFLADSHNRKLTVKIVEELISSSAEISLDKLFSSIVLKNKKLVNHEVNLIDKNNYMLVIRAYQNFLIRLISVQQELGSIGIESAMNKLKPPLFGRQRTDFIEVVRKSRLEKNLARLEKAIELECHIKTLPINQTQLLVQKLYEIVLV